MDMMPDCLKQSSDDGLVYPIVFRDENTKFQAHVILGTLRRMIDAVFWPACTANHCKPEMGALSGRTLEFEFTAKGRYEFFTDRKTES